MATINGIVSALCDLAKAKYKYSNQLANDYDSHSAKKMMKMMSGFVLNSKILRYQVLLDIEDKLLDDGEPKVAASSDSTYVPDTSTSSKSFSLAKMTDALLEYDAAPSK